MTTPAYFKIKLGRSFKAVARGWAVAAVPLVALVALLAEFMGPALR